MLLFFLTMTGDQENREKNGSYFKFTIQGFTLKTQACLTWPNSFSLIIVSCRLYIHERLKTFHIRKKINVFRLSKVFSMSIPTKKLTSYFLFLYILLQQYSQSIYNKVQKNIRLNSSLIHKYVDI